MERERRLCFAVPRFGVPVAAQHLLLRSYSLSPRIRARTRFASAASTGSSYRTAFQITSRLIRS